MYGGKKMFESKYSKVLTGILIVVIIAIVGLLGFLGYDYFQKYNTTKEASEFVDNFQGDVSMGDSDDQNVTENVVNPLDQLNSTPTGGSSTTNTKKQYKGFNMVGTMEIPAINFKYPVLEKVSTPALEQSVAVLYPNGENLNQPGNTVIIGHNYRNGLFFSNNKKLSIGDKITVTDYRGKKIVYTIYDKFETNDQDTSFYQRDTGGKAEITLSTCTDASNNVRLIILAKE
jgi:LPXTG-site transpeptidase (sortase) family protein